MTLFYPSYVHVKTTSVENKCPNQSYDRADVLNLMSYLTLISLHPPHFWRQKYLTIFWFSSWPSLVTAIYKVYKIHKRILKYINNINPMGKWLKNYRSSECHLWRKTCFFCNKKLYTKVKLTFRPFGDRMIRMILSAIKSRKHCSLFVLFFSNMPSCFMVCINSLRSFLISFSYMLQSNSSLCHYQQLPFFFA